MHPRFYKFGKVLFFVNLVVFLAYLSFTLRFVILPTSHKHDLASLKFSHRLSEAQYPENATNIRIKHELQTETRAVVIKREDKETRFGPGELGKPVKLKESNLSDTDKLRLNEGYKRHGFNELASDLISIHRSIDKIRRDKRCLEHTYSNLTKASIVIPIRDEAWSVLLRTLHSILSRTPLQLIKEIILVDDNSQMDQMKGRLDWYISFLPKVRIIRLGESTVRSLMISRQRGINDAKSDIVIVIDSHIEVTKGWIEPLISRVMEKPRVLAAPIVDEIYADTFAYDYYKPKPQAMTFDFHLDQDWMPYKEEYLKTIDWSKPYRTTGIQGNVLVFNKTFFNQLGGLDTGMKVWGGEQQELMFKYVMCGGDIEIIPCSHIGHLYRKRLIWANELHDSKIMNKMSNQYRVAEVWMDEYKDLVFHRLGNYSLTSGDVESRRKIRRDNNCKPFQYFIDRVLNMVDLHVPINLTYYGLIRQGDKCLVPEWDGAHMETCHRKGYSQFWDLAKDGRLRNENGCLVMLDGIVKAMRCQIWIHRDQKWKYLNGNMLQSLKTGLCVTLSKKMKLVGETCTSGASNQTWHWEK